MQELGLPTGAYFIYLLEEVATGMLQKCGSRTEECSLKGPAAAVVLLLKFQFRTESQTNSIQSRHNSNLNGACCSHSPSSRRNQGKLSISPDAILLIGSQTKILASQ
jgi:hypothetical protein